MRFQTSNAKTINIKKLSKYRKLCNSFKSEQKWLYVIFFVSFIYYKKLQKW